MVDFSKKSALVTMIIGILVMQAHALWAQTNNSGQMTDLSLPALADAATHHLPLLMQRQALVNSAKAGVQDAKHNFLPSLDALDAINVASANSLPGSYESFGIIPSVSSGISGANNYQAATGNIGILYSQYALENFGLRKATIGNAEAVMEVRQADLDRQTYIVKAQVGRLYFQLLKDQYQLGVEAQNVQRYLTIDTVIHALTYSGIRPGVDSSFAKAEISKAKIAYNKVLGELGQLVQQLSYLTGIPPDQIHLDTTGRQYTPPDANLLANGFDSIQNPLLNYYRQQKQYYLSNETLVKKTYLPKLYLVGGAWGRGSSIDYTDKYKDLNTGLGYQRFNYMVGLTFSYNLFDGIHRKDKLNQARYETQAADLDRQQQELNLRSDEAQAMEAIKEAVSNLKEIPVQMQSATDAYNQKVAQYKAGLINLVDLTEASYVLYSAQISYVETLNTWFLASLDKATATGNLDQFISRIK